MRKAEEEILVLTLFNMKELIWQKYQSTVRPPIYLAWSWNHAQTVSGTNRY